MATTDAAPVLAPDPSAAPAGSTGVVRDRVAIGASAGGVQALKELVATLPADYGGTIFVVVHIAARAPRILFAAMADPSPAPSMTMPASASRRTTARAIVAATSG